jgi:hypothetical protein
MVKKTFVSESPLPLTTARMHELQIHEAQCFNLLLTLLAFGFMQHVTKLAMRGVIIIH